MSFFCPECRNPSTLKIKKSIELLPDSRSDEITLQLIECTGCKFRGIAAYEESHRGSLDDVSFSHTGYYTNEQSIALLKALIKRCPNPKNKRCNCDAHEKLGRHNQLGRSMVYSLFNLSSQFQMRLFSAS
jgi:hypothetical protein